jgi:hypothetical protein
MRFSSADAAMFSPNSPAPGMTLAALLAANQAQAQAGACAAPAAAAVIAASAHSLPWQYGGGGFGHASNACAAAGVNSSSDTAGMMAAIAQHQAAGGGSAGADGVLGLMQRVQAGELGECSSEAMSEVLSYLMQQLQHQAVA